MFFQQTGDGKKTILIVYVDDINLTGDNIVEMERLKKTLSTEFEVKDLGQIRYFLGMDVARSKEGKRTEDIKKPVERDKYQRLVGKLIYLSHTRPDIAFAVSVVSQHMHSPKEAHLEAVYKILRYLKGSSSKGLFFKKNASKEVEVFIDADWVGSIEDRRSTIEYCTFVFGNLVTWRSKKHNVVAISSVEAEFRPVAQGICEVLWLRKLLEEL
ncbi:secreted RxLR effector protein 161-like [Pistacia vera]|uniref:secreted RxLR effector protein 161-like n=1 Tax=Pistacia vera TaxID=55513 RepID=UPI001262FE0D|nr:secreted RxLR effector protein 161-like [Pistacia vera]